MKGIKIFGNEIKLSQFADDTTLFNADLGSLEKTLKIVEDFGKLAGLYLNVKKIFHGFIALENSWDPFFL